MPLYDDDPPCHNNYLECGFVETKLMPENHDAYEIFKINRLQLIRKKVENQDGHVREKTVDVKTSSIWDTINGFEMENKKAIFIKVLNTFRSLIKEDLI